MQTKLINQRFKSCDKVETCIVQFHLFDKQTIEETKMVTN